jgi:hypothetical protein
VRNALGGVIATTLVSSGGTWSVTPSVAFLSGNYTLSIDSTLGNSTLIGNTISFTVSSPTGCGGGGGGGSSTGPGGPSPSPYRYPIVSSTPLAPAPIPVKPVIVKPATPVTRYEIAHILERKSLNVKPYWERVQGIKPTPTKTFLGTGPKNLTERTYVVTSKRVQTSDDMLTKKSQGKKTFPHPLLGN